MWLSIIYKKWVLNVVQEALRILQLYQIIQNYTQKIWIVLYVCDILRVKYLQVVCSVELNYIQNVTIIGWIIQKKHIDSPVLSCYCLTLESDYYIDAYDYPRGILAMINDCRFSDNIYNCQFKVEPEKAEVWSISNITSGSELYLDYGDEYRKYR